MLRAFILIVGLFSALASVQAAVIYDFDVGYDGSTVTVDGGSVDPIGVNLEIGDSFNYNVQTANNDYWQVDVAGSFFPFFALGTNDSAVRYADVSLSLLLDGVEVFSYSEFNLWHANVHIGTNSISLAAGLLFDEMVMDYQLLSSGSGNTNTITDYFWGNRSPETFSEISYVESSEVPEPGSIVLLILGLSGLAFSRKKLK